MSPTADVEFPSYLKAYFPSRLNVTKFTLGEHSHDLRFKVTLDPLPKNNPFITLSEGPSDDGNTLAIVGNLKDYLGTWSSVIQVNDGATTMYNRCDDTYRLYHFSLKLHGSRREEFEWRPTEGNEVHEMFRHAKGFKLVRLKSVGPGARKGGKRKERQVDETSDGKEVVAIWATEKSLIQGNLILGIKPFKFELRASGKSGDLGSEFGYFALASALKIWAWKSLGISGFKFVG
ncbi:hypothetical protein F4811DRAFT_555804 [Daldinia bambusicola]|nr:hypothetical protein F4811DRAFT_555804 [Daldinia bambusicola]